MSHSAPRGGNGHQNSTEKARCVVRTPQPIDGRTSWGFQRKHMRTSRQTLQHKDKCPLRTRPTNNQLLYKAYFRWQHFPKTSYDNEMHLMSETDACASVTAAFLQVLAGLQDAEVAISSQPRNIFKILSTDTRHTKVVDLSSATHRVSDELRRHCLTDNAGSQYSTNLDRNRYGTDDQYMFTVIRHNLRTLDLCPCLVDVEVLDQKSNESILVSAGADACSCQNRDGGGLNGQLLRPTISTSERFDALIAAATGETECSDHNDGPNSPPSLRSKSLSLPRSRLLHTSQCEVDSLQQAMRTYKAEDEVVNGLYHMSESTRDSSKRVKRSCSSLNPPRLFGSGLSDMPWSGLPEKVEDNVRGDVQPEALEAHQEAQMPTQDPMVATGKRGREPEGDLAQWHQVRFVGKQSSVCRATPSQVTPVEFKRLGAEVRDLANEFRQAREELCVAKREAESSAACRREVDNDRKRLRRLENDVEALRTEVAKIQAEKASSDERAKDDLTMSREVISLLLRRLNGFLANPAGGQGAANCDVLKQMRPHAPMPENMSGLPVQASDTPLQATASSQQLSVQERMFSQSHAQVQAQAHAQAQADAQAQIQCHGQTDPQSLVAMLSPMNQNFMLSLGGQSTSSTVLSVGGNMDQTLIPVSQMPLLQTPAPSDMLPLGIGDPLSVRASLETSIALGAAGRGLDARMLGGQVPHPHQGPARVKMEYPKGLPQGLLLEKLELEKLASQVGSQVLPQGM
ncbi:unnamed protein product [Ostreobium quekettii]|uniref:Uncharacterized protein n=1 Tax=Ostreobium quekettii TaxID=121088 RepID=A0A8S1IUN5_9CHLO|nr:unnamed protein product [Ostreobium quekettii]